MTPIAVFGLAARNGDHHLGEAIESLLTQTCDQLSVIVVDDASTDRTADIVREYVELDSRVLYERNAQPLGLVRNWRRAFDRARELFPAAPYFAWASDHDVWHPRWLEALAAELDTHPEAALAYPLTVRTDEFGAEYPRREVLFDTAGVTAPAERLRRVAREMAAPGEMIYGLFRAEALERCGAFPLVLLPDRLHLVRLSLEGEFHQVRRRLWHRRYRTGVAMSNRRQRRAFFPDGVPLRSYMPWWAVHFVVLRRSLAGHPGRARLAGSLLLESLHDAYVSRRERVRRERRWRRRERRRRFRALARASLERVGLRAPEPAVSADPEIDELRLGDALHALERAELLDELARPGAVVLELGRPSGLENELRKRLPDIVYVHQDVPASTIDLAVSIGAFERLAAEELERLVCRLHELGVSVVYSLDRETEMLRSALGSGYWLYDVWAGSDGRGRKPDPIAGPVPRTPGRYRSLVGRRRLLLESGG